MQPISPETPEVRGRDRTHHPTLDRLPLRQRVGEIVKRIGMGVYADGFIHAGNLAYLALISLFPFFIVVAALAHLFGRGPDTAMAVESVLRTLPRAVRELLRQPIRDVLLQRTGSLLWLGGLVGLWTTGSFIETIRDILRRAYGAPYSAPFWHYRLASVALVIGAVVLMLVAFTAQLLLTGLEQFIERLLPAADDLLGWIGWSRLAPLLALFVALYLIFYTMSPSKYRTRRYPKWPGAVFTACWWVAMTMALPRVIALLGGYDLTYGSLAGVIVALFFFWLVGFGLVIGAHLNAALAERPENGVRGRPNGTGKEG